MDAFFERLIVRAATIDELLSGDFEPVPGQKGDTDLATRRLAAWCRSSASGDWSLFGRRLERDGLTFDVVLTRFATVRRKLSATPPAWIGDAIWIETALQKPANTAELQAGEPCAFEQLFEPVVRQAAQLLWADVEARVFNNLTESARVCLRYSLLKDLCSLSAPALYELFARARKAGETTSDALNSEPGVTTARYDQFIAEMKAGGFRRLFEDKPVLLRLMAVITRQWIEASREFVLRLDADLSTIRRDILRSNAGSLVDKIEGDLSDPHNNGRSVRIVSFMDGSRVVYKPKDLRLDVAWHKLVEKLNGAGSPIELKTVRAIAPNGYGWSEFIEHTECADRDGCKRFFRRAGAWLALFHCFVANDMHQENMIAAGEHPVPIDLETILQSNLEERGVSGSEAEAFDVATEILANSVMMVGLLPAYGRSPENKVFAIGGMTADWISKIEIKWININSDDMHPIRSKETSKRNPNLPCVDGSYVVFGDYTDDFIAGFEDYSKFLARRNGAAGQMFDGFACVPVRKVIRPTRFYSMLLQRLKNHRAMDDGIVWSAQADFVARLAQWDEDSDRLWPVQRIERSALLALNIPHFVSPSDKSVLRDAAGFSMRTGGESGLDRAGARVRSFDEGEIAWQTEVIKENTRSLLKSRKTSSQQVKAAPRSDPIVSPSNKEFTAEADKISEELSLHAIRRGPGAAWIGLDWLGDAEVFQLICLGSDLYNGVSGIALFLAAHAMVTGRRSSGELALAGVAHLRKNLKSRNAARMARSLGIGAATGLGSIVYALTVMSKLLHDDGLRADAHVAAELFTDDLIAADRQLDVIGGSAGAILCLLRLYQDSHSEDVLKRAIRCGEHLMGQDRLGPEGRRSWLGQGLGQQALNGMSHGATGFAYALAALSSATGRDEFAQAASECIAFEDSNYDAGHSNWPDLRGGGKPSWPCQWCHGAPGIGIGRIAAASRGGMDSKVLKKDIENAVEGALRGWPGNVDTLCCGTLGSIEFFCEAGRSLERNDLRELASRRLMAVLETARSTGDYRWNSGNRQFNLGLFRGLAGVGYTALRRVDGSLPNVLIWE